MTTTPIFGFEMWAGDEQSHAKAMSAIATIRAGVMDNQISPDDDEEEMDEPYSYELQGNIGVVTIRGSLVNDDSPYNEYLGVTSYDEIRRAMLYGVQDPECQAIMLDIQSGGGAVSGLSDTADLISTVNSKLKPVYTYTGGCMLSAGYWLGSSGEKVYVSQTADVGSVGIIVTLTEYSKMRKDAGITDTVIRIGKYKALVNPLEPLSDAAKKQVTDQAQAIYEIFADYVAKQRGTSRQNFDASMGEGRQFMGKDAVAVGMADAVMSFDDAMSLITQKVIDKVTKKDQTANSFYRGQQMTQALTQQQIAALAAGAPLNVDAAAAAAAAATALTATNPAAGTVTTHPTPPTAPAPAAAGTDAVVSLLSGQVREANAVITAMTIELTATKAQLDTVKATQAGLLAVAAGSLQNMKIALGHSGFSAAALTAEQVLAEVAATRSIFEKQFVAGGVASPAATTATDPKATADADLALINLQRTVQANRVPVRK